MSSTAPTERPCGAHVAPFALRAVPPRGSERLRSGRAALMLPPSRCALSPQGGASAFGAAVRRSCCPLRAARCPPKGERAPSERPGGAHKATSRLLSAFRASRCRVVHRAWLWATRPASLRPRGVLSTTAQHPVGNPCSTQPCAGCVLTDVRTTIERNDRLPCPRGDCQRRSPCKGPHETCSPRGAGRPRRAPGCSATPTKQERRFMSFPPRLPTRTVIAQLLGVCP